MSETRLEQAIGRLEGSISSLRRSVDQLSNEIDSLKRMMSKVLEYELAAMTPEDRQATKDQVRIDRFKAYQEGPKDASS